MSGRRCRRHEPHEIWIWIFSLLPCSSAFKAPLHWRQQCTATSTVERGRVRTYTPPAACGARFKLLHKADLGDCRRTTPRKFGVRCFAAPLEELPNSEAESVEPTVMEARNSGSSVALAKDECFLAADGAEYCVPDPAAQPPLSSPLYSSGASSSLRVAASAAAEATAVENGSADGGAGGATSLWIMMGLCFLVAIVCALDRVAMSVAIVPMGQAYGYSDTTKGLISSVFSWGYMASIVPSSVFIGVFGPKATMTGGVLVWSAAQILSPGGAAASLPALLACRFAMGVGEAVTMPSIQAIVADRVPRDKRSGWLSLIISGLQIGTVLAYLASPPIIEAWSWEGVFIAYGVLGLVWLGLWLPFMPGRDTPEGAAEAPAREGASLASQTTPEEEREGLLLPKSVETNEAVAPPGNTNGLRTLSVETVALPGGGARAPSVNRGAASTTATVNGTMKDVKWEGREEEQGLGVLREFRSVPWKAYATNGQILTITAAHMAHNWGLYVMLAWLPTYFSQEFSMSLGQSSGASVVPWVAGAITGNMAGWSADFLVNKGILDVRAVRKAFQTVALVGPAACMLALAQGPETSTQAIILFTTVVALGSCSSAGFGSSVQDLRSRNTGVIYGMTSACSAVMGSMGTYLTGVVLDTTDSWELVFKMTAAVYIIGATIYGAFYRAEPLVLKEA